MSNKPNFQNLSLQFTRKLHTTSTVNHPISSASPKTEQETPDLSRNHPKLTHKDTNPLWGVTPPLAPYPRCGQKLQEKGTTPDRVNHFQKSTN
ncbi:hypothetical protein JTE90_024215 [Oedothorax gibbosus]|uniref:Uncharacterized protein n=1 Tax=Oedothorax gibbosus TaxID=931172 RepID=A0AAV6U7S9_9ARAC|nr:hypothetical protein JTE90_024215 [Oedothorax gibbosus]